MANFLGNVCPKCGNPDQIDVAATVWVRLTADGSDADASGNADHEYDNTSLAQCGACDFGGTLGDFIPVVTISDEEG